MQFGVDWEKMFMKFSNLKNSKKSWNLWRIILTLLRKVFKNKLIFSLALFFSRFFHYKMEEFVCLSTLKITFTCTYDQLLSLNSNFESRQQTKIQQKQSFYDKNVRCCLNTISSYKIFCTFILLHTIWCI